VTEPSARAKQRAASRESALARVAISYPEELPVSQRRDDIAEAIGNHQVVIVAGETGSGKTTQLPKICLELGRGITGQIGHTQPRRIAARTVAERIAEELGTQLGDIVGYKVRFTDKSGDATAVKLMTDGILLAEIANDRNLTRYDTLIIDEAHERSLNIDFILGYLRQLLPRRPDLKVIITSATIDPERFAEHFKDQRTQETRPDHRGLRPHLPGRGPLYRPINGKLDDRSGKPTRTAIRSPPSPTRSANWSARAQVTSSSSSPASRRSATPPTRSRGGRASTYSRCTRACPPPSSTGCSRSRPTGASPAAAWSSPPTSPRPRSPSPASGT